MNTKVYANKSFALGLIDITLLMSNASQLNWLLSAPYWDIYHKVNVSLIIISIILQLGVGVALIFIHGRDSRKFQEEDKEHHHHQTSAKNDTVVALIIVINFVINFVNIIVACYTDVFKCPPRATIDSRAVLL